MTNMAGIVSSIGSASRADKTAMADICLRYLELLASSDALEEFLNSIYGPDWLPKGNGTYRDTPVNIQTGTRRPNETEAPLAPVREDLANRLPGSVASKLTG